METRKKMLISFEFDELNVNNYYEIGRFLQLYAEIFKKLSIEVEEGDIKLSTLRGNLGDKTVICSV